MATALSDHAVWAMRMAFSQFGERPRRVYAATEALKLGRGGIARVAAILGCHRRTIERGIAELQRGESFPAGRSHRKKGAAEKPASKSSPTSTRLS